MGQIISVKYDDGMHIKEIKNPESVGYNVGNRMWEIQHQRIQHNGATQRVVTKVKNLTEIVEQF